MPSASPLQDDEARKVAREEKRRRKEEKKLKKDRRLLVEPSPSSGDQVFVLLSSSEEEEDASRTQDSVARNRRGTGQAWTPEEEEMMLLAVLKSGVRGVDWAQLLSDINSKRDTERTVKSLRCHWDQALRKKLFRGLYDSHVPRTPYLDATGQSTDASATRKRKSAA
jgi:hypothetical protein